MSITMRFLWSSNLSLATPTMHLASPRIVKVLSGDDLLSYAAARVLSADVRVFQPEPLASITKKIAFNDEGIASFEGPALLMELSRPLMLFGALERIFYESPDAIAALLHEPWSLPSDAVASYVGTFTTSREQEEVHETLATFVETVSSSIVAEAEETALFLTGSPLLGRLYLERQTGLSKANTLAVLATSGIKLAFPRLGTVSEDELARVHQILAEERENYLDALNTIILESYAGLKSGSIEEAYRFADFNSNTRLELERRKFEQAMQKLELSAVKRLGLVALEGLPAIARSLSTSGASLPARVGVELLSVCCSFLGKSWSERKLSDQYPIGSYAYRVEQLLAAH